MVTIRFRTHPIAQKRHSMTCYSPTDPLSTTHTNTASSSLQTYSTTSSPSCCSQHKPRVCRHSETWYASSTWCLTQWILSTWHPWFLQLCKHSSQFLPKCWCTMHSGLQTHWNLVCSQYLISNSIIIAYMASLIFATLPTFIPIPTKVLMYSTPILYPASSRRSLRLLNLLCYFHDPRPSLPLSPLTALPTTCDPHGL